MRSGLRFTLFLFSFLFFSFINKEDFTLFDNKGNQVSYKKLVKQLAETDVVLFGELHDNRAAHELQTKLLKDLYGFKKNNLVVGAEMFEADDQLKIDELIEGVITMSSFEKEAKLWNNFSDYKPLLEYSVEKKLNFVATNIPRRYANLVARKGLSALDSLSIEAKNYVAPLPLNIDLSLPGYEALKPEYMHAHGGLIYMAEAQAIKDATMAHFILKNFKKGDLFLHVNGAYHSDNYEGIYWMLKQKMRDLKVVTISTISAESLQKPADDVLKKADFLLVVKELED